MATNPFENLQSIGLPVLDQYKSPFGQYMEGSEFMSPTNAMASGIGSQPSIFGFSSESPMAGDVTNTTQDASKTSGNLMQALESVNKFYKEGMKGMYEGIPAKGSEDIRLKLSAYGRPYTTVNVSARDASGQYKERTEYDATGKPFKTRGGIEEGMLGRPQTIQQTSPVATIQPQKEAPKVNPTAVSSAFTTPQQNEIDVENRAAKLRQEAADLRKKKTQVM